MSSVAAVVVEEPLLTEIDRDADGECGSFAFDAVEFDITPVLFDDLVNDGESKSCAKVLCGKVWFKDL